MKSPFELYGPIIIGIPALIWFAYSTNWKAAVAMFLVLLANNLSQTVVREQDR